MLTASQGLFSPRNIRAVLIVYISFVFIQSLFFKFADSPETQHIFGTLDQWAADSFGISGLFLAPGIFNAYVIGSAELVASALMLAGFFTAYKLLIPVGAALAFGIISGAIFFHLFTPLGIDVGDGGVLFAMACGVWLASATLFYWHRGLVLGLFLTQKQNTEATLNT